MKQCAKCKQEFPETLEYFYFVKAKNTLKSYCKKCDNIICKEYQSKNKKKVKESRREYYLNNIEYFKEESRKYRIINREEGIKYQKEYRIKNKEKINKKENEYLRNKRKTNIGYRLKKNISRAINHSLRGRKNGRHWEILVGYTQKELYDHLQKQFKNGMNWQNYGEWEIDHKLPVSRFNIISTECEDFKRCWSLNNLQPLWRNSNRNKQNKVLDKYAQLKFIHCI